jgi:DNA-binding CsgD family transcriptional regulator
VIIEEDDLLHYGILRRSGRYPWGSGGNVDQRSKGFFDYVEDMKNQGLNEAQIAQGVGLTLSQLRATRTLATASKKQSQISQAQRLKNTGMSNVAIGKEMGINESVVRTLLKPGAADKSNVLITTSDMLRREVANKTYIDVGDGVEAKLKISKEKLRASVSILEDEGYRVHTNVKVPQLGTRHDTNMKILTPPGTTRGDVYKNRDKIRQIQEFSDSGGRSYANVHDVIPVNPKRIGIIYKDQGGGEADGVIFIRPGVKDLTLGGKMYAQVRVQVGDNHYLKGMAMYKEGMPAGVDLQFNTKKSSTGNKLDAMKVMSEDPDLPFGAVTRQVLENKGTPKERNISAMNIVNEEGNWADWSKKLSSQFLSKQNPSLALEQLHMTYERRLEDFNRIMSLTNPTIKKHLLQAFAEATDSSAVHMDAAALSARQQWHTILPVPSMKPDEIYAPNYNNGERVVLIRYPHGGTFEIPELTVNNRNKEARGLLGQAQDAVGIHHSVAERLSGADFDGDTVVVIPNNRGKIKSTPALEGLKGFDPQELYKAYPGMVPITPARKQIEMGSITNLITDMTVHGAPPSKIAQAIRHSMVVIDAENHNLDYRKSAIDNGIPKLQAEYQKASKSGKGASTLLSRATAEIWVNQRKLRAAKDGGPIDPKTGKLVYVETGRKTSKGTPKTVPTEQLAVVDDAHKLSSGTRMEAIYAQHSNDLKALANASRVAMVKTPSLKYSSSARETYAPEYKSLASKLRAAQENRPRERQAQVIANAEVQAKRDANPNLAESTITKIKFQSLEKARVRMGASKKEAQVQITPREWDAIQSGAISDHMLKQILTNTDIEVIRKYAEPKFVYKMTPAKTRRAASMRASGYTRAEIAAQLGVSLTTLDTALKGD